MGWRELVEEKKQDVGASVMPSSDVSANESTNWRDLVERKGAGVSAPKQQVIQAPQGGGRTGNSQRIKQRDQEISGQLGEYKSGSLSSGDVTPQRIDEIQKARIAEIPEITGSFKNLSQNLGFTDALVGMTAFDPDEFGAILTASDPNIGVVTTPEGERIAVNRQTNEMMSINKIGPSLMDAIQVGGAAAMFTPAGALPGIAKQAVGAMGTQALIEGAQEYKGGEFNPADVVITGAGVPVVAGLMKYGKGAIDNFRRSVRAADSLIDVNTGALTPEFNKALEKYDMDVGALIDDQGNFPVIYSGNKADDVVESIVKKQLTSGDKGKHLATLRLDKRGNIGKDDLGAQAIKHGYDPGDVTAIKQANAETRGSAKKMLQMQRAILTDKSKVDIFRPSDKVGDSVMDRFNFVRSQADKLAKNLDDLAEREFAPNRIGKAGLKKLEIDTSNIEKNIYDGLKKLGVNGVDDLFSGDSTKVLAAIKQKGFFDGSDIMVDPTSQNIIKDVFKLLGQQKDGNVDAYAAHKIKRQIDRLIDFRKKDSKGLTKEGRNFAKKIRAAMNDSIRDVSEDYAKINDKLSMSLKAMNAVEDSTGRRIDLFDKNANQAIGTEVRKLLSNYGVRQTLNNSLNQIDDASKALGGKFSTDFRELNRFANVLDKRFGSVAENSFKGNIDSALDLNRLRNTSIKEMIAEKGLGRIADKFGPNDKKALDLMQELLVRGK